MGTEIERKFLVKNNSWKTANGGVEYRQGYLSVDPEKTVRIRTAANRGFITVKGKTTGATRAEFEYEIPLTDATIMLRDLCDKPLIEKTRYKTSYCGQTWEIDEFAGDNAGLVVAEVELTAEDQQIELPGWIGREVTADPRYYNASLYKNPFKNWPEQPSAKN